MQHFYSKVKTKRLLLQVFFALKRKKVPLIISSTIFLLPSLVFSQDIHYSQFHNAPYNINPALTGIARGDIRVMGSYRSQWRSVPVDYTTYTIAADMQFLERYYKEGFFAGGVVLSQDIAGISRLQTINIGVSGSYIKKLDPHVYASMGVQLSANQRAFQLGELTFDNQYNEGRGIFESDRPIGETFASRNNFFFDVAAGFNIRFQSNDNAALVDRLEKRSKLDIGIGIGHITMPDQSFIDGATSRLSMRISPYAQGRLKLANNIDLVGNFLGQFQDPYKELLVMGGATFYLSRKLGRQLAAQLDFGYRFNDEFGDAYIPGIELFYNGWRVGFSYDVNVSGFDISTDGRGGPEFSIRYLIRKVRPLPQFRACPLM